MSNDLRIQKIKVPAEVYNAIRELKESGLADMKNVENVVNILKDCKLDSVANWVSENKPFYFLGLDAGFIKG